MGKKEIGYYHGESLKDIMRSFFVPFALVIAAAIIGKSMITSAYIISASIRMQGVSSGQASAELAQMLKNREPGGMPSAAGARDTPEAVGSKRVEGVTAGSNPPKGAASAPVVMVEFSDFQCPFTKKFYHQAFAQLNREYIATGKVRFCFRDLPLAMHPFARPAARAARCAGMQGKYWEMFDKLLQGDSLDQETLKRYARELGLNVASFQKSMDDPALAQAIENDLKDAETFGATGTPAFFINGRFVSGAYPYDVFKGIIEEELAQQAKKK